MQKTKKNNSVTKIFSEKRKRDILLTKKTKLKILSWNVNGIRAGINKGFWKKINNLKPDILCLQEIKASQDIMESLYQKYTKENLKLEDSGLFSPSKTTKKEEENSLFYLQNWSSCSIKKGYSGVLTGVLENSRFLQDISFEKSKLAEIDQEGRVLITKFSLNLNTSKSSLNSKKPEKSLKIAVINGYYPQGGRGQTRIDYKLDFYSKIYEIAEKLQKQNYKIILTGDFNTTVLDIDLARPKANKNTTGCLPEERLALNWLLDLKPSDMKEYQDRGFFEQNFQASIQKYQELKKLRGRKSLGLIDAFRYFYPTLNDKYTYWDQITKARERNVGWRIDMFLVDPKLKPYLKDSLILDQIMGSDHCPILLELEF